MPEVGTFTALRNLLYAFEWWFFGAFAAFVWWRWVRDEQAVMDGRGSVGRLRRVRNLFLTYRALAFVVGVLLLALAVGMVLKYTLTEGTDLQTFGDSLTGTVALIHGWVYIVYVVVAFLLSRRAGWSLQYLVLMLLAGLIPVLIFWVEHNVAARLRAEHAELR